MSNQITINKALIRVITNNKKVNRLIEKNNLLLDDVRVKSGRNLLRLKTFAPLFEQTLFTTILTDLNHGVFTATAAFFGIDGDLVSVATDLGP